MGVHPAGSSSGGLAWQIPLDMKISGDRGKLVLRKVRENMCQLPLLERRKEGFTVPLGGWLRDPLCGWEESLLDESRLLREDYLHPAPIRHSWEQHLGGKCDWSLRLWGVLMFQAWLETDC
jgi:asparagine synthase (glutamine-hydrolysing)